MSMLPVIMVGIVVLATIWLGIYTTRMSRTASDFFVAGRAVSVFWNSSAISGEYLSAASFMGVAGLVMRYGYDVLWYPVGYATGYLFLLLFIAGPLRRFGAYTIPDFAEGRFESPLFRKIAVTFVLFIGLFYTMPQMKGAGVAMTSILQTPHWVGVCLVGVVITLNVALGGMKGITFVQAFQYWLKMFAISVPIFVLMAVYGGYGKMVSRAAADPTGRPVYGSDAKRSFKAGDALTLPPGVIRLTMVTDVSLKSLGPAKKPSGELPAADAFIDSVELPAGAVRAVDNLFWPAGSVLTLKPAAASGGPLPGKLEFTRKATVQFRAGDMAAGTVSNRDWISPFGGLTNKQGYPLLYTFSLIIGLICGTAGLPHILVRFYTNPDGRSARRTALWVMVLIGAFYLFPGMWGALGRFLMPELYANGRHDAVVVELPQVLGSPWGDVLRGITAAGAFAAFMSTFSGLLVSMSGALAHDIYGRMLRPKAPPGEKLVAFRVAAMAVGLISTLLGLMVESWDIAMLVGWAFAIAAASYFPLLLLGSWWRGLTMKGAAVGMLAGGLCSLGAIVSTMLIDRGVLHWQPSPLVRTLMEQPAIWGVPLSIGLMLIISRLTAREVSPNADQIMLRLHAPEELGLSRDYVQDHA